jgi:SAM-dependent methyltransferase
MNRITTVAFIKWLWRGKSLTRATLNARLEQEHALPGVVIDLGGGGEPSYKSILKVTGSVIYMDVISEICPKVVWDLEAAHPFEDDSADTILSFNTLEHDFSYQHVINKIYRVLRANGRSLIYVPFMFPVHTYQAYAFLIDAFFRYTRSSLEKFFSQSCFKQVNIMRIGGPLLVISELLGLLVPHRLLRLPIFLVSFLLEYFCSMLRPRESADRFPLAYVVVATK